MKISYIKLVILFLWVILSPVLSKADNIRIISNREGISSNSILSLAQDRDGRIYFGTCDGLDIWDGNEMKAVSNKWQSESGTSGKLIEKIIPAGDMYFWVSTNYGLDLMESGRIIQNHDQFRATFHLCSTSLDKTIVLTIKNELFGYCPQTQSFIQIDDKSAISFSNHLLMYGNKSNDSIFHFQRDGIYKSRFMNTSRDQPCNITDPELILEKKLIFACHDRNEVIHAVDDEGKLYRFLPRTETLDYTYDISNLINEHGNISDIILDGNDIIVSFLFGGAVRLKYHSGSAVRYSIDKIIAECGIFDMMKDAYQDIIWLATDGQGVFMYAKDNVSFYGIEYRDLPYNVSKPIRAIKLDSRNTLWIGTKGEGILRFSDFKKGMKPDIKSSRLLTTADGLSSSTVYAFEESAERDLIYIGTEGKGIDYWSHKDNRIHHLKGSIPDDLQWVHAIHESHPDTLWVATVGKGIFRLALSGGYHPYIKDWKKLDIEFPTKNDEFFFSLFADNDGTFWFGNRGGGLVHYDPGFDESSIYTFNETRGDIANDIWTIIRDRNDNMWVGTSYGLLSINPCGTGKDTPVKNTVHGILEGQNGTLWLTTNKGLISYDSNTHEYSTYDYRFGIETIEYSDGAVYSDEEIGLMFFGGTNGLVVKEDTDYIEKEYNPLLTFTYAKINNEDFLIQDLMKDEWLKINHRNTLTSIKVSAVDHINGGNYSYSYNIGGYDDHWIDTPNTIRLAELPHGKYVLKVTYTNRATGYTSPIESIKLHIMAPPYATTIAKVAYLLLFIMAVIGAAYTYISKKQKEKTEQIRKIEDRFKEETMKTRLHIMENLTQELAVPVTTISTLAQHIGEYSKKEGYLKPFCDNLTHESERLGNILTLFHNMSGPEESRSEGAKIFSMKDLVTSFIDPYIKLAEKKMVRIDVKIPENLIWHSNPQTIAYIMDLLLTNAIIHTSANRAVTLKGSAGNGLMSISISNSEIWLKEEEIKQVMDTFDAWELFHTKSESGASIQDEMRIGISCKMASSIDGWISYETSDSGDMAFIVHIPHKSASDESTEPIEFKPAFEPAIEQSIMESGKPARYEWSEGRQLIYILGNDAGIMNAVADIFCHDFNIKMFKDINDFNEGIHKRIPDLIICENIQDSKEISSAISSMKQNKKTIRIPIILLTSIQSAAESLKESAADISIRVPFNLNYLKTTVNKSLARFESLKDYFSSSLSAYEFSDGKLLHNEDKEFLEKLYEIIRDNISNTEITTAMIAEKMCVSQRKLYHKLSETINITPSNILKEYRLLYAERLLTTTKMSIDDIIFKSGFANRGTFFKNFSVKYGMTPRQYRQHRTEEAKENITR